MAWALVAAPEGPEEAGNLQVVKPYPEEACAVEAVAGSCGCSPAEGMLELVEED